MAYSRIKEEYDKLDIPEQNIYSENTIEIEIMSETDVKLKAETIECSQEDYVEEYVVEIDEDQQLIDEQDESCIYDSVNVSENEIEDDIKPFSEIFTLECKPCNIDFHTFDEFSIHFKTVHNTKAFIECCAKLFYTKSTALKHAETHMNTDRVPCDVCGKLFKNSSILSKHMLTHLPESQKPYQCSICSERFAKKHMLKKHKLKHPDEGEYKCDICDKTVRSKSALMSHKKVVHERVYEQMCEICARIFSTKSSLDYHYKSFHQDNRAEEAVECQVCGSILKDKYIHKRHMIRHMESRVPCDLCGKDYPNSNAMKMHKKRFHFDKRDLICSVCGKGFKRELVLKEHMATHTGEVLYKCVYCPFSSNSSATMYAHKKKKHPKERELEEVLKKECKKSGYMDVYRPEQLKPEEK